MENRNTGELHISGRNAVEGGEKYLNAVFALSEDKDLAFYQEYLKKEILNNEGAINYGNTFGGTVDTPVSSSIYPTAYKVVDKIYSGEEAVVDFGMVYLADSSPASLATTVAAKIGLRNPELGEMFSRRNVDNREAIKEYLDLLENSQSEMDKGFKNSAAHEKHRANVIKLEWQLSDEEIARFKEPTKTLSVENMTSGQITITGKQTGKDEYGDDYLGIDHVTHDLSEEFDLNFYLRELIGQSRENDGRYFFDGEFNDQIRPSSYEIRESSSGVADYGSIDHLGNLSTRNGVNKNEAVERYLNALANASEASANDSPGTAIERRNEASLISNEWRISERDIDRYKKEAEAASLNLRSKPEMVAANETKNHESGDNKMKNERHFLIEITTMLGSMEVNEVELHSAPSFRELDLKAIATSRTGTDSDDTYDEKVQGWVDESGAIVKHPSVVSELTEAEKVKWEEAMQFKRMNRPVLLENEGAYYYVDVKDQAGDLKRKVVCEAEEFIENGFVTKEEVFEFGLSKADAKNISESRAEFKDGMEIEMVHKGYIEDSGLTEKFEYVNYTDEIRSIPSRKTVAFEVEGQWVLNPHVDSMLLMDNDKLRLSEIIKDNKTKGGNDLVDDLNGALREQLDRDKSQGKSEAVTASAGR